MKISEIYRNSGANWSVGGQNSTYTVFNYKLLVKANILSAHQKREVDCTGSTIMED